MLRTRARSARPGHGARTATSAASRRADTGNHWDAWHRVTLYGDVTEPLAELGRALGLKIIEEA